MVLDISKVDLYALLEVGNEATEKEIVKAYRKKALKCHPDKNPDNPKAAEEFLQISKALEILTDAGARAAYDKVQKTKKAAAERHRELDSKRKKLKEDLEARERAAQSEQVSKDVAQKMEAEIARLRKQGLTLTWLSGKPTTQPSPSGFAAATQPQAPCTYQPWTSQERDYESIVLMRMRQAEERKRLIEQMQKEDEAE